MNALVDFLFCLLAIGKSHVELPYISTQALGAHNMVILVIHSFWIWREVLSTAISFYQL
jgi:hypothetical protein